MIDNLYHFSRADQQLELGNVVTACWVADGYSYSGRARIIELRRASVKVSLLQKIGQNGRYPIGKNLELPRFCDQTRWSQRNCIRSVG